jgi:hypothetical protein
LTAFLRSQCEDDERRAEWLPERRDVPILTYQNPGPVGTTLKGLLA